MHEFSIANQAVDKIMEAARDNGAKRIHSIELILGELSMIGSEQFMFWMREILSSKGDIADDVKIDLKMANGRDCVLNRIQLEV